MGNVYTYFTGLNPDGVKFSTPLVQATQRQLEFLQMIDNQKEICSDAVVRRAIYRYEKIWLPWKSREPEAVLLPPLDVYWIWHVHMLSPVAYARDCRELVGTMIDHEYYTDKSLLKLAYERTIREWDEKYGDSEPYHLDYAVIAQTPPEPESAVAMYVRKSSYDLAAAVDRQKVFYYNVSLPHYRDEKFIEEAVHRYKKFLLLRTVDPKVFIVPCFDVDLVWHTHQVHTQSYVNDMRAVLGYVLNHDDTAKDRSPGSQQQVGQEATWKLWGETYKEPFPRSGAMLRGPLPRSVFQKGSTQEAFAARTYGASVLINRLSIRDFKGDTMPRLMRIRHFAENDYPSFFELKDPIQTLEEDKDLLIDPFDIDTSSSSLRITLEGPYDSTDSHRQILAECIIQLKLKSGSDLDSSYQREESCSLVRCLDDGSTEDMESTLQMTATLTPKGPGFCLLTVQPGVFAQEKLPSINSWEEPAMYVVANHSLVNSEGVVCYSAHVRQSVSGANSLIQIQNPRGERVAQVQTIDSCSLPSEDQVKYPEKCLVLDEHHERALLVKDAMGDSAILIGRWSTFKNGMRLDVPEKNNPGFFQVQWHDIRGKLQTAQNIPHRVQMGTKFSFAASFGPVHIDLLSGVISMDFPDQLNIEDSETDTLAHQVALAMAVPVLFALCLPVVPQPPTDSGSATSARGIDLRALRLVRDMYSLSTDMLDYLSPTLDWSNECDGDYEPTTGIGQSNAAYLKDAKVGENEEETAF